MTGLPSLPIDLSELELFVDQREAAAHASSPLKPGNAAGIEWAFASDRQRTPASIVYLHGFSASRGEAEQAVRYMAAVLKANAYFARLPGHGHAADDAQRGLTCAGLVDAARYALAVGRRLGEKVILVGTSMGASLALALAAEYPDLVAAVVAWSPGIDAPPRRAAQIRELAAAPDRLYPDESPRPAAEAASWATCRHSDGYRALVELMDAHMQPATFAGITAPVFLGYYFRDDARQDESASVFAMRGMFDQLGTPADQREEHAYPDGHHALVHPGRSAAAVTVVDDTIAFLQAQVIKRRR